MLPSLAVVIIVTQILITYLFYKVYKTLAHPTVFFHLYVTIHIVFALTAFYKSNLSYYGIIWISVAVLFFSLGGMIPYIKKNKNIREEYTKSITLVLNKNVAQWGLLFTIIIGYCYSFDYLSKYGVSLYHLFDINSLLALNNNAAIERYSGNSGEQLSLLNRLFLVSIYVASLIGGYNLNFLKDKYSRVLSLMSITPSILVVLTQNTKAILIGSLFLFIAGFITSSVFTNRGLPALTLKRCVVVFVLLIVFFGINYSSMIMRIGTFDLTVLRIVNEKFVLYAFGHIPAFDIWFTSNIDSIKHYFGLNTFYGIADFIGLKERTQGIYIDRVNWDQWSTNVFTAFRPFLEDFGPYLGIALMFFWGLAMSLIFIGVSRFKKKGINLILLPGFYFCVLYGFITSAWAYMSYILAFVLFFIYSYMITIKQNTSDSLERGEKS